MIHYLQIQASEYFKNLFAGSYEDIFGGGYVTMGTGIFDALVMRFGIVQKMRDATGAMHLM